MNCEKVVLWAVCICSSLPIAYFHKVTGQGRCKIVFKDGDYENGQDVVLTNFMNSWQSLMNGEDLNVTVEGLWIKVGKFFGKTFF